MTEPRSRKFLSTLRWALIDLRDHRVLATTIQGIEEDAVEAMSYAIDAHVDQGRALSHLRVVYTGPVRELRTVPPVRKYRLNTKRDKDDRPDYRGKADPTGIDE